MADNEYLGLAKEFAGQQEQPAPVSGAQAGMYAAGVEPVRGESVEIARELNLPVGTVERNFDELSKVAKRRRIDYGKLATDAPLTNGWLADPVNASVAGDDIDNLVGIEQAWDYLKKGASALGSGLPKFNEGVYGLAQMATDTARTYVTEPLSKPINTGLFDLQVLPNDPLAPVSDFFSELRQGQKGLADRMMPKADGAVEAGVYSGLQSFGQNMLTLPAAIMSGNPGVALAPMVGGVAGQEYGRARDKGVDYSAAAVYATSQAAVEFATEKLPMGMLIKDLEKNTGFISMFAKQLAAEMPGEQIATILQDLNEWAVLNPDKSFNQYLAERPNAALQTAVATVVGTGGMVTTAKAIEKAAGMFDARANKAAKAMEARKAFERISKAVEQIKFKNVSPSTMQAFSDHVAQGGSVYVDANQLANALQQSGIDINQAMADIPSIGEQFQQKAAAGQHIKIPAGEFLTKVAGTNYAQAMLKHLKTDPNDWSQAEADDVVKGNNEAAKAEVERIIKVQRDRDAHEASADVVRKNFEDQLNTANRFSKDVNKAYALMISSFYSVTAARLGITPEQMADMYQLQVKAENVGQAANTLKQDIEAAPEGSYVSWVINNDPVFDEEGNETAGEDYALIEKIFVPKESRGRGAGRALLRNALREITAAHPGMDIKLAALPFDDGMDMEDLVSFYESEGFDVDNTDGDAVVMKFDGRIRGNTLNQDAKSPRAQISFANDITSTPTVITLLKGANLSSFIHESGHFFLEVLADISSRPNAPMVLIDDFKTVMDWFGVTREQWATMTLEEKRPYHEQFARGFEVYAWEGKAPSLALSKLFQRFRAWMLDAYKKLLDAFNNKDLGKGLDVRLSDDVRAVFGRMLATQEQINEANLARGYLPAFETKAEAEAAGVDWEEYRANIEQADQDAITALESRSLRDMQWFRNAHNKEVRRLRREAAGLRREARIAARAEVLSHPVYRVMQFLTAPVDTLKVKKAKGDPNVVDPATDTLLVAVAKLGGLQRDMAIDQFGLDPGDFKKTPVFGKPILRRNGGMTPDGMAEALAQLGYMPSKFGESWDMNDLGDFLHDEGKGIPHYSATFDYRTLEDKTGGMQDLEANPFAGGRIDRESMVREYGGSTEEFPWENLGAMLSNDGIHPDVIADQFGFQSGDEMVRFLMEAKDMVSAIEDRTDQIMLERHGDLTSKEAIEKAADEAIHNRMRAKVLATEANALSKTLGARGITAKAARIFVERILAGMRIIDIKPAHFAAEEAKAAARFERALKKGNSTKTENQKVNVNDLALEKRNQLVNNIATRLAYDAEAEIEKAVKHFKQLQKPGSQKAMRGEYLEQLNILLERFELRGAGNTKKAIKKADTLPKFADWLQAKAEELGAPTPDMVAFVLDGGVRKPYRDMTLEEFRGLVDAVKQLEHLARREQKQYMEIRGMEFEQEKNAILDRLRQFHPEAFDADGKPKGQAPDFVPSLKAKLGDNADAMLGEFLGNETIINILEGGDLGLLHESFFKRISDRSNWRTTRLEGVFKKLEPLFDQYSVMEKRAFSMKDIGGEIGIPITREKALGVALLVGNAEGRERVRNYGWTDEQIIKIIDLLDERDKRLAEGIWDLFDNDLWPDLKALNERTAGKAPPKVEATPFTNRLGTWPGGYMRLKYDTDLDERAYKFDVEQSLSDLRNGMGMTGKTPQGTSQERKKGVLMRPRLDFGVFVETVTETVHDIAYREAVSDVIRLLNDKEIQAAIKQAVGKEVFRAMRRRVAEVAARPRDPYGFIEKFVSIARRNAIVTLMSGVGTALQNLTGYIPATGRVNAWLLSREVARFGRHPKQMYDFATSRSEYMRHRFTSYEQDLVNTAKNLTVNGSMMPDTATFLALMGWIDRGVAVPVWNAAFAEGMEKYQADTSLAVEYADHVVRQTQGSGRIVDKAGIMTGHPLKTIFTMFYSYFNSQLQQLVRAGLISKQEAKTNPRKAAGRVAMAFVVFWILPALVTEMFRRTPDDEDDEEKAARYAKGLLLYPAAMFPIVRDIAPWAWDKYVADSGWARSFRMSPVESAVEGVAKGIESTVDIAKGDGDQKDVKNLLMGVGFTFGVPGKLISDFVTGTYDFATGEAGPQAMLVGPEPTKK